MSVKSLWCEKCGKVAQNISRVVESLKSCPMCGGKNVELKDETPPLQPDPAAPVSVAPGGLEDLRALFDTLDKRVSALEQAAKPADPPAETAPEVTENPGLTDSEPGTSEGA